MSTEQEVKQWAREEWAALDRAKLLKEQAACNHARSGSFRPGTTIVVCDDCGKELNMDEDR